MSDNQDDFPNDMPPRPPRPDFTGVRPLISSGGMTWGRHASLCEVLCQPAMKFQVRFKPDVDQAARHTFQRRLAELLERLDLLGGYASDESYLVLGLLRPLTPEDRALVARWLRTRPELHRVFISNDPLLAQELANVAAGEVASDEPKATLQLFELIFALHHERMECRLELEEAQGAISPTAHGKGDAS